jgi:hypothetical protein
MRNSLQFSYKCYPKQLKRLTVVWLRVSVVGPPHVRIPGYASIGIFEFQPTTICVSGSGMGSYCDYIRPIPLEISLSVCPIELLLQVCGYRETEQDQLSIYLDRTTISIC